MRALYGSLRESNSATRASGALGRAIRDRRFWYATATEIKFINKDLLDKEARHWRRLNFGAGAGAITPPGQFQLALGSQMIGAAIGLAPDPRPAFTLPRGFFLGSGGQWQPPGTPGTGVFIPLGKTPRSTTHGIVATNFLDAGVKRLLREIGIQYLGLLEDFVRTMAEGESGSVSGSVRIPVVFLRGQAANKSGKRPDVAPEMRTYLNANLKHWLTEIAPHDLNRNNRARRLTPPKPLQV
jgi:hypothetical protein